MDKKVTADTRNLKQKNRRKVQGKYGYSMLEVVFADDGQ